MAIFFNKRQATPGHEAVKPVGKRDDSHKRQESLRETIESIVFAFVLAFLFRTFEAEAFVIPTGSMAPTLYGRHKEGACEQCGYWFVVGASDEVHHELGYLLPNTRVEAAICPNCRYPSNSLSQSLAFNGDRILVTKYPYEFGEPNRWDVFVFKFPEEPKTNYIKRLVGRPNEKIRVRNGDAYLFDEDQGEQILRKEDPDKQRQIQIVVYDDDYPPRDLLEAGWPERWAAVERVPSREVHDWKPTDRGWTHDADARSFALAGPPADDGQLHWVRYRHLVPSPSDWETALARRPVTARPQLISDFCGYNAYYGSSGQRREMPRSPEDVETGAFWVGDLTATVELTAADVRAGAEFVIELCEGVLWYRCRIDLNTGQATLTEVNVQLDADEELVLGSALAPISGAGTWEVSFANVDDRLCLWVDDELVEFGDSALLKRFAVETPLALTSDLKPVGVAAKNVDARIAHLRIDRDIFYRKTFDEHEHGENQQLDNEVHNLSRLLHDPAAWSHAYAEGGAFLRQRDYHLGPDEYLAFGDNSPRSRDSRLWSTGVGVPRKFLVGKAFWIYWPHGVPFLNDGRGFPVLYHKTRGPGGGLVKVNEYPKFTFPFYPQVWRMNRIR
jgi:signal peptidase I